MSRKSTIMTLAALAALTLAAGCGSSTKVPTAIDTAPPAAPIDLAVTFDVDCLLVTWAPNTTDADFAGFVVRRTANDNVAMLIATPTNITEYADPAPVAHCVNEYAVSAVDESGNESAWATVTIDMRGGGRPAVRPAQMPTNDSD